jgi:aspartate-semialdehyde dehydrogenase
VDIYRVGVAGATGYVGQRLIARLAGHPWFRLKALGASGRSAGRRYADAARWALSGSIPDEAAALTLGPCDEGTFRECDVVLSALDAAVAREVEPALVRAGLAVVSNSSAFRMSDEVPLVVPEVNADHILGLRSRAGRGFLVTNPNCSATGLALALCPLHRAFGVRRVVVATLQAVSGAGLDGPRAIDLLDNVVPYIPNEEEKIEAEIGKILGRATAGGFTPAPMSVSAHCHRVPILEGHMEAVSVELGADVSPEDAADAMRRFRGDVADLGLPSAPAPPLVLREAADRPQTRLDRDEGGGMTVVVGRVRRCPVLGLRLVVLSHNTVRGAAGGALLNAELLAAKGVLAKRALA